MGAMEPHVQQESYWSALERTRIDVMRAFSCKECEHCHSWQAKAGGGTVPVGFCKRQDMPLDASDLRTSQWDMCGDDLLEEWREGL